MSKKKRRISQCEAIREMMIASVWAPYWTLGELREQMLQRYSIFASEAGISARLRDLRKKGYTVERRLRGKSQHLWEYKLVLSSPQPSGAVPRRADTIAEKASSSEVGPGSAEMPTAPTLFDLNQLRQTGSRWDNDEGESNAGH